jgi:hypothetical protein
MPSFQRLDQAYDFQATDIQVPNLADYGFVRQFQILFHARKASTWYIGIFREKENHCGGIVLLWRGHPDGFQILSHARPRVQA